MEYVILNEDVGKRLDIFLLEKNEKMTRSYIKNLIDEQKVLVNSKVTLKGGYKLKENDVITFLIPEKKSINVSPQNIPLDIVYEDKDIIIVNKKKGMVVHPANGNYEGTLVNSLMYSHKNELSTINGIIRPGIVHRIDKDTSGILVIAKNDMAHKELSNQFKIHSIKRKYIALVKGIIKQDELTIDAPIGRNIKDRKKMAVTLKNSRNAVTHVNVLKRYYNSNITLIEASLETGRTHQIRVHMSYKGYPLLGDEVYGKKDTNFKTKGQMLHAKILGFQHPSTKKYIEFESELPKEFRDIVDVLEKREKSN